MKKRGFSGFDVIGTLIIGLLVVVILSALFPNLLLGWFRSYKNLSSEVITPGNMQFTPFTPILSQEQKNLENSLGLLVTGIESVAYGQVKDQNFYKSHECSDENDVCIRCDSEEDKKLKCFVKGFELPQHITNANEWITGYGDPLYLLYYEKFPHGEEKTWQFGMSKLAVAGLVIQGVFTALPFGGALKTLKSLRMGSVTKYLNMFEKVSTATDPIKKQKLAKKLTKLADKLSAEGKLDESLAALAKMVVMGKNVIPTERLVDDFSQGVYLQVMRRFLRQDVSGNMILQNKDSLAQSIDKLAKEMNIPFQKSDELAKDLVNVAERGGGINSIDDIKMMLKDYDIDEIALTRFTAVGPGSEIGKSAVKKMAQRSSFKKLVKTWVEDGTAAEQLKKSYTGLTQLEKTNPAVYRRVVKDVDEFIGTEFLERQVVDGVEVLVPRLDKLGVVKDDTVLKFLKVVEDEPKAIQGINDLFSKEFATRFASKTGQLSFGTAAGETIPGKFAGFLKDKTKVLGCFGIKPNKGIVGDCNAFIRNHYLPILFGLGYLMYKIDSTNQKFIPVGENTLSLIKPLEEGPVLKRNLIDIDGYFIATTRDKSQTPTRFFLASPCKVDLAITNKYCKGKVSDGDYLEVYKNKYGQEIHQPIEPIEISEDKIKKYYAWDTWMDERRIAFLNGRNMGDPWYRRFLKDGSDEVFYKLIGSPEDLKTALKFLYYTYPGADISKFFEQLKKTDLGRGARGINALTYVCNADAQYFEDPNQQQSISLPTVNEWVSFNNGFVYKLQKVLGMPTVNNECFKEFIDYLVEFSVEHPYGDPKEFIFTCQATGQTITMKGAYARHYLNTLIGRFDGDKENDVNSMPCGGTRAEEERGFDYNDGVAYVVTANAYNDWVKLNQQRLDWAKFKTWDTWEQVGYSYGFTVPRNLLIYKSGFFDYIARESAYNLNYIYKEDIDAIKRKYNGDPVVKTLNIEKTEILTEAPTPYNIWLNEELEVTIPCIIITPDLTPYSSWNNGNNYCYTGRSFALELAEDAAIGASVVGSITLMVLTEGAATPFLTIAVGTADVASFASILILDRCGKWPIHAPSIGKCV